MHFWFLCLTLVCAGGLDVAPQSMDAFSAHRGLAFQSIRLTNPSAFDVAVQLRISRPRPRPSVRRLGSVPSHGQDSQKCASPSRLLARFHKVEGDVDGVLHRRLREELHNSYAWQHLPNLDMEILDTCDGPAKVLSELTAKYGSMLEFAEMDQFVYPNSIPDDPHWPRLWGLDKIRMLDAWSRLTELGLDGEETVVAVIDTGVQLDHPDLMDSLWTNPGEIPDNGIDDDGNGFIDDVHGYDFAGEDGHPDDDNGHGTHCAGILAATANNGVGIAGVASRLAKVRIMALRFLSADGTGGTVSDAVRALEYALSFGVPVSSNSWGGADTSDALKVAIRRASEAGHLFVAPAGNSGRSISDGTYYPCVYRQAGVLCVAASDQSDQLTSFSNYAPEYVEIAAPGVDIYSTYTGSGYRSEFGTSMATPYVAGAASLVVSAFGYSGTHVRQLLLDSAVLADNFKGKVDGGRLDVLKLIERSEPDFLFWFDSEGARTAMVSVIVAANSSKLVELQIGSDNILPGTYEAEVHTSWHDGEETIPVVYTVQGQPLLHLEQHSLEWAQVPSNATASQYLNITNSGNGTGRVQLQRLPFPFEGPENEIVVPPEGAASVSIQCAPNFTGEWLGEAAFNTNSGLDAWNSSRSTLELGTVLKVRLRCISRKPPELQMEPFSGAAEVLSGGLLRYLQPVVHAEWEPFVPGKEVEANLVLPEENNSLGCSRHNTDVSGSVLLIGRGDCYFSVKALMAQEAQALGVLLYNNQDNGALPMMAMPRDSDIPVIPMFMVTKAEGEALLARLQEEALRVKLRWQTVSAYTLPSRSDRVSIQISNTGVADLRWNARPKLSFGAHSFYETYISGVQNSSMAEFSWTEVGEDLSFFREHGQNASLQLPLPFSFSFYGQMFDKVWVTSNGFLAFEIFEGEAPPLPLPFMAGISKPNGIVAGFGWPLTCHDCRISSMEDGTCFVVQYANMSFDHPTLPMSAGSDGLSFEIRLCQDGRISMMYAKFPEPASDYRDAFIGLETIEGDALMNLRSQLPFAERTPFAVTLQPWLRAASATQGRLLQGESVELFYDVHSTIGHSGFIQVTAQDQSGLWHSQRDVRVMQETFTFRMMAGEWGTCVLEDCENLSSGVRSRPLECHGVDGYVYDLDTCNGRSAFCADSVAEWRDKDGARCQEYEGKSWCDADGSYGSGWKQSWGNFSDFSFGGLDVSTVCCACGGGVLTAEPVTLARCDENLAAMDTDCDGTIDCQDACPLDPQPECTSTQTVTGEGTNESDTSVSTTGRSTGAGFAANVTTNYTNESSWTSTAPPACIILLPSPTNMSGESTVVDSIDSTGARGVLWPSITSFFLTLILAQ
ncbi:Thermophilic serine proteinase (Ak.1 protease) [Durusdinium trenchii]|uniref:subtilisin n=1 Tax=Durusdinium trenchii TaxID=1381693 RepID=A0ABP0JJU1_9DINO